MSCECYKIGGRFIAEDPDCPAHGIEAQRLRAEEESFEAARRDAAHRLAASCEEAMSSDDPHFIRDCLRESIRFLREQV
jgi:hypothetical protein